MEKIWRDESDTGNKCKVKRIVQKLLVFFEKNLNKIANLYQKICKKKINEREARERQHNQLIIQNQQIQAQAIQVFQQQQAHILVLLLQRQ